MLVVVCMYISHCCRSVMNLTRGEKGNYPCPVCYVPKNEQSDLTKTHEPRTALDTQQIYRLASIQTTQAACEDLLKSRGLRMLEVIIPFDLYTQASDLMLTQPRMRSGPLNFLTRMLLLHLTICIIMRMAWVVNIFGQNFSDTSTIFVGKQ